MENLTITEILIRMILGMLFSGILGYEREQKGRPAGFRTYIVVCMGAEIAMMTGIYLKIYMGDPDSSRIAAQVISGISFLGAGTILVDKAESGKRTDDCSWTLGRCLSGTCVGSRILFWSNSGAFSHSGVQCAFCIQWINC